MYKYIGLDAHSSTCTFCVVDTHGAEIDMTTIVTNGRLLIDYVKSLGGTITIAFEECDLSSWLFDLFQKHVHKVVVCNPVANVEYKRAKTDKIDARNLAHLLRGGFLKAVFHDGSSREKFRMLVSGYEDLIQETVRVKNRLRTIKRRARLAGDRTIDTHAQFIEERLTNQLESLLQTRREYRKRLIACARRFKETRCLTSLPGIEALQASKIIAQVVDPGRFQNKYKFWSYCGLVRHQRISAGRAYGTKRIWGNRILKCVFKMAAHSALKGKNALRLYYESLRAKGVSDKSARNAVARKIAAISLVLWKHNQRYDERKVIEHLSVQG